LCYDENYGSVSGPPVDEMFYAKSTYIYSH